MNDPKLKQQIADKIKDASNILVTVSSDPSVDELSAALGLTLLLNKMDKHATAIFSGKTPPAITFLDPGKTFENTTDSLRDFIIALDKEKADHLRYKLEGDLVKIYITPYRTTITNEDLEFSQGDYNVELVIALGVESKDHLDTALDGHGKILHDAAVITLTAGEQVSNLGTIDWHDNNASSLSEMLGALYESMKVDKKLLDKVIATAWLTGIVAATERFSNPRTSSRAMTLAATLMAAGADQQLIAARLDEATQAEESASKTDDKEGKTELTEGKSAKLSKSKDKKEAKKPRADGELLISHEKKGTLDEVANEVGAERLEASTRAAERALEKHVESMTPQAPPSVPQSPADEQSAPSFPEVELSPAPSGPVAYTPSTDMSPAKAQNESAEPTFGGTLNATSEQAEEDKRRELEKEKNKVILSHNYIGDQAPTYDAAINSAAGTSDERPLADPFSAAASAPTAPSAAVEPPSTPTVAVQDMTPPGEAPAQQAAPVQAPSSAPSPTPPTLADIDSKNRMSGDDARAAVEAALEAAPAAQPAAPAPAPDLPSMSEGLPLPPPPPLPTDFAAGMPPPPLPPAMTASEPERLGDILTSEPVPAAPVASATPSAPQQPPAPLPSNDPGQFRIPGA